MAKEKRDNEYVVVRGTDKNEIVDEVKSAKSYPKRWKNVSIILICMLLLSGTVISCYVGMRRVKAAYQQAEEETYNNIYHTTFEKAEAANHVSNHVLISIGDVQEIARLEVLTVQGSEFVIKNAEEKDKITSWIEVKGVGLYTVDLSMGEFIADSEREYVLVRVPKPVLTEVTILGTDKQFWKDDRIVANGSVQEGVQLSAVQMAEGEIKLEDSMRRSRRFNEESKNAAVRIITSLVQEWNPNIPELQVDVEFIESNA